MIAGVVLENGPQYLLDNCDLVTLCSAAPTTYAQGSQEDSSAGYRLGSKVPSWSMVNGSPSGRAARLAAITDGVIEDTGGGASGMCLALLDTGASALLGVLDLTGDQVVTEGTGNIWKTAAAIDAYTVPDPT